MTSPQRVEVSPDLSGPPGLRAYLESPTPLNGPGVILAGLDVVGRPAQPWRQRGPVHRTRWRRRPVDGEVPEGLSGTLYRNGPGRWEDHPDARCTICSDGDGMIRRSASTTGRSLSQPLCAHPALPRQGRDEGTSVPMRPGLDGQYRPFPAEPGQHQYRRTCWPSLCALGGRTTPRINPEALETLGYAGFSGELRWAGTYSAHPCLCPSSGDMYNFGVEFIPNPHLRVYRTNRRGRLKHYRSVSLPYVAMVHDFAITERYLVFLVSPIIPDGIPITLELRPSVTG